MRKFTYFLLKKFLLKVKYENKGILAGDFKSYES